MQPPISIAIHGGAGTILRSKMSEQLKQEMLAVLEASVRAGYEVLQANGDAADATIAAVKVMEDSPHFNAGKGSVLTHEESIEMDASIMHGKALNAGAVAGIKGIKNPIELANAVMLNSDHVFLIADGAHRFAQSQDFEFLEEEYFVTERRRQQLQSMKEKGIFALSESKYPDDKKFGTVGAVALDCFGNLAAATSTGGVTNKKFGRVGDSPIIGAGTYAENGNVAVSTTGVGEYFIRKTVASDLAARMRYLKEDVHAASEQVIHGELEAMGGEGGLIALDSNGDIHFAMNSSGMYRASIDAQGSITVKIYADE
ncbi:isoaspartyl peptidase/L-asparaginase family protein [Vibrio breoganii]|uniref:Isoaspartyl peptidase n=1 Tax=Vibrio breoganii TaxID=553239 RepID=A0AAP8MZ77_9VIBR|nr:isoaspartyl peptidase/L-asparaginase [Vibrio breoganii]NMO75311.1 isoaspartyl peptidase/L-asparaginase [Vibrio breoganii]NMR71848.1 isoaspartyl peptidase/L-asparaginase [Vibrio breoganii]PMG02238.1 peptidase [Vibrio breoganii]PML91602.1 peptidase [Vibrio breoganii]PMO61706.1 peptidase [Vibrio breoganii]